jgi:hypothetical protein
MQHGRNMEQAISTAPESTRSLDEIVDDIVLELGGARGESLVESENDTRAWVTAHVECSVRAKQQERSRKQRKAEADHAERLDGLLAELESMLKHPLTPAPDTGLLSGIERMRATCRMKTLPWFRPKGGRNVDYTKRNCAGVALHLVRRYSRLPISGSAETAHPAITALLYEAVTGERDANCKRAYEWILRYNRR